MHTQNLLQKEVSSKRKGNHRHSCTSNHCTNECRPVLVHQIPRGPAQVVFDTITPSFKMKKSTLPHSGDWTEEWLPRVKHRLWEPEFLATRVWVYLKIVVLIKLGIFCISRDKPEVWSEWWPVNIWCFLCGHLCSFLTMNAEEASSVSHSECANSLESQGEDPRPSLSALFVCLFAAVPKTCISVPGTSLFCEWVTMLEC